MRYAANGTETTVHHCTHVCTESEALRELHDRLRTATARIQEQADQIWHAREELALLREHVARIARTIEPDHK